MSGVSKDAYFDPDKALSELMIQEQLVTEAIDIQALLRILVDKEIITKEEVDKYRNEVRSSPKYANAINIIEKQKRGFESAKENPQEYLKAMLKAKMDGKI